MKTLFCVLLTFLSVHYLSAKSDEYVVFSKDKEKLGNLSVTSDKKGEVEELRVKSEIRIKSVFTMIISYTLYSKFVNNKLVSNSITTYRNLRLKDHMRTEKMDTGYTFTKNSEKSEVKDVSFCESMLYYNEPKNKSEIYSEFDGVFKSVNYDEKEACYELTNPLNMNVSKYYFTNGKLHKAIVKSAVITLYLFLKTDEN